MRVLITGASGFAGGWLCRACVEAGDTVVGLSRSGSVPDGAAGIAVDLRDSDAILSAVRRAAPDVVYHLAALSNVGRSWSEPATTLDVNGRGAISLLEAVRIAAGDARVVWVSSSEVYGTVTELPIAETSPPTPESPYAVSKLAGEGLANVYAHAYGLRVVIARPFSHSGPGQRSLYLMSNLCRQAADARRSGQESLRVVTGRAQTRRDFTDVRDVVRAYRMLAADDSLAGVFNICSGVTRSTAEQVAALAALIDPIAVEHVVDPARVRASEVLELRGTHARLTAASGWQPRIPFETTLADTLAHWDASTGGKDHARQVS